jgi:hypothetical protein
MGSTSSILCKKSAKTESKYVDQVVVEDNCNFESREFDPDYSTDYDLSNSSRSTSRHSTHGVNWTLLDELLKKNLRQKNKNISFSEEWSLPETKNPNSFAAKGISIEWLFQWWDRMKSHSPRCSSYSTRELWLFLSTNIHDSKLLQGEGSFDSVSPTDDFILYDHIVSSEAKGFPDFVLAYNPEDNFEEIMKILKFHYHNKVSGEINRFQYIWIDFFLLDLCRLIEYNNQNIFYYSSCSSSSPLTGEHENPVFSLPDHDERLNDLKETFGSEIKNLVIIHVSKSGDDKKQSWKSIGFLKNVYSLFYLSFFLWNGVGASGKICFLFSKDYCFHYQHLLHLMKEWQPMNLAYYYENEKNNKKAEVTVVKRKELEEDELTYTEVFGQDNNFTSSAHNPSVSSSSTSTSSFSAASVALSLVPVSSLLRISGSTHRNFQCLSQEILSIFETWNTLKVFLFFYLLKYYNISPFFFGEISPLCVGSGGPLTKGNLLPSKKVSSSASSCTDYTPRTITEDYSTELNKENSVDEKLEDCLLNKQFANSYSLWSELLPGSRMNWKQMFNAYHFYYYDYKFVKQTRSKSKVAPTTFHK